MYKRQAYQNALNSNATTQTETLAKIEQAITQAQLTGCFLYTSKETVR